MCAGGPCAAGPLLIVGMGGSGTRVTARIAQEFGWFMGYRRNESEDALDLAAFDYRWSPGFVCGTLAPYDLRRMEQEHGRALARHLHGCPKGGRWGWKHPPSIHLLEWYAARHPGLRVLHLLRDGRDMSFSQTGGLAHLQRLGPAVLDGDDTPYRWNRERPWGAQRPPEGRRDHSPERAMAFWAAVNDSAANVGERVLGERYCRIRFEDMVADGSSALDRLETFMRPTDEGPRRASTAIARPASVGRWHSADGAVRDRITEIGRAALQRFRYL